MAIEIIDKSAVENIDLLARELGFDPLDPSEHEKLPFLYMREGVRNYAHRNNGFYMTVDGRVARDNGQKDIKLGGHVFVGHREYGIVDSLSVGDYEESKRAIASGASGRYEDLIKRRKAKQT